MTAFRAAFKAYRMHQVLILPRFARLTFALGLATAVFPVDAEYYFNPRFLSNDLAESVDLSAFTKGREAPPGTYRVDIYLNDEFMASRDITFIADDNNADLIPCLVPFSHWMRTDSQSAFRNSNASYSMSNDLKGGMTNLSGVYGTLLPDNNLNYSVQVGNTQGGNTSSGTSGYSSLNYRGAYGNTNVGYSRSGDSSQIYYGMSGGIIAHADGITFGQPLGDTMVLVKAPGADNVKIENQTGIHTDWRGYAILPFATEYRENRVALNANSLADNVELDETVVTVIPTHGAIARATFNAQIGGKVLMTLKYGNKSVPFGAIVTHGENKNGSIVAENGQVYLTGLPQSGKLQVSWGNDKNSNCIVDYKLPAVSPGTLLNQQTAICR
ncbi:fimbria/pilus outer membrane usher protein [Escherichia coli]|nr:fimbria/pilus outer membrane usher protein [Escherichia coli]HAX8998616.1 fimbria/pilus outer membrane usher protein [Escherichia coli]HAX9007524.1 fimbria/pilus outer membrane usher protein [Escherichia coli]HAX9419762.1 fimbria/pilus outer membrane usher protein [Escherichia coli]HAX9579715.1 fimbria/pilus outer membrane usher protein [Escherichia coli]